MPSEAQIEEKLKDYCRKHGIYTRKFASPSNRGVPDRIFCKNGKVLFMELKKPGNEPTDLQHREIGLLRTHGMNATWCDNYAEAAAHLERLFADAKNLI